MKIGEQKEKSNVEKQNFIPIKTEKLTLRGEIAKMKKMGFGKGSRYFWDYYKWWVIGIVLLTVACVSIFSSILSSKRPRFLVGAFYNRATVGDETKFCQEFADAAGIDLQKNPIEFAVNQMYDTGLSSSSLDYAAWIKFEAQVSEGDLDFVVTDEELLETFCSGKRGVRYMADLREVLPNDLLKQLEGRLVWCTNVEGEEFPAAVDVSDSGLDDALQFQQKPACLGILVNSERADNVAMLLEYIFGE